MYTKPKRLSSNIVDLSNYIENYDVYNSKLLSILADPNIYKESFIITASNYRPDLIAERYYGSADYTGLVILQSKKRLFEFVEGTELALIPKQMLDKIIDSIE